MGTEHRLNRFRRRMDELQVPAAFLTCGESVRYLSGFSGSTALLVVTSQRARLVTDFRYARQAADECPHLEVHIIESSGSYREGARAALEELGVRLAAVEAEHLSLKAMDDYRAGLPGIALAPVADLVAPLRHIKDAEELAAIRDACLLADRGFEFILGRLRPGISERAVAAELEYFLKREGAEREAFDTIVASGPRSALPHGRASDRLLQVGDFITFDFGARVRGYNSDLTRTVVLGRADDRQREIYGIVLQALLRAREAIRPGASGTAVDAVARDFIGEQGYRENFGHGLGHGLGRLVHDHLGFSPKQDIVLEEGMVLTVEPGIYLDGWGGVRIEDDVLVTAQGCEVLTHAPRELIEVPV